MFIIHEHTNNWIYFLNDVNVSKQTTLLDGVEVGMPKWRVPMGGLIVRVHEAIFTFPLQILK